MEKIKKLKSIIEKENIDGYLIPKNDEFFGEYVPEYNDRLKYISNFTGSYGLSLILKDKNYFLATKILAKHDENYMPPEVKEAIGDK